jgi:hypothetical protein
MIFIKEDLKINDTKVEILAGILNHCALINECDQILLGPIERLLLNETMTM